MELVQISPYKHGCAHRWAWIPQDWICRPHRVAALALLVTAGYWAAAIYPAHLRAVATVKEVNTQVAAVTWQHHALHERLAQARRHAHDLESIPAPVLEAAQHLAAAREEYLKATERLLVSLGTAPPLTPITTAASGASARAAAQALQAVLDQAQAAFSQAEALGEAERELVALADTVAAAKSDAQIVGYPGRLKKAKTGIFARLDRDLGAGDTDEVKAGLRELAQLRKEAGELSGLLRKAMDLYQTGRRAAKTATGRKALARAQAAFTKSRSAGDLPKARETFAKLKALSESMQSGMGSPQNETG